MMRKIRWDIGLGMVRRCYWFGVAKNACKDRACWLWSVGFCIGKRWKCLNGWVFIHSWWKDRLSHPLKSGSGVNKRKPRWQKREEREKGEWINESLTVTSTEHQPFLTQTDPQAKGGTGIEVCSFFLFHKNYLSLTNNN